jgi:hypothetical protein
MYCDSAGFCADLISLRNEMGDAMGRKPLGKKPMSNAERQRRWRQRHRQPKRGRPFGREVLMLVCQAAAARGVEFSDLTSKVILDACCGGRCFWFDKRHPHALYLDIRQVKPGHIETMPSWCVEPDVIGDYRALPFGDKTFRMVVWDVPHMLRKSSGILSKKYGSLGDSFREDLRRGFDQCWRVLKVFGVLAFKFADLEIPISEILGLFPVRPLVGTTTRKNVTNTFWFLFMKIPD